MIERLQNFIDGGWCPSRRADALKVLNPASAQVLAEVPLSLAAEVGQAAQAALRTFAGWRRRCRHFFLSGWGTQTKVVIERWPRDWSRKF